MKDPGRERPGDAFRSYEGKLEQNAVSKPGTRRSQWPRSVGLDDVLQAGLKECPFVDLMRTQLRARL